MPNWQIVDEAHVRLVKVREALDKGFAAIIEGRNAGALPVIEILAAEVQQLTLAVLAALGPSPASLPDGSDAAAT